MCNKGIFELWEVVMEIRKFFIIEEMYFNQVNNFYRCYFFLVVECIFYIWRFLLEDFCVFDVDEIQDVSKVFHYIFIFLEDIQLLIIRFKGILFYSIIVGGGDI